jgi:predicted dehydrogenase
VGLSLFCRKPVHSVNGGTLVRTLVVGLGRAGAGLHLPVLARLRATSSQRLFADEPFVACDPGPVGPVPTDGTTVVTSVAQAARLLDPARTVVHLCTPPSGRPLVLAELAAAGFRRFVVEKPLAADPADLAAVVALRDRYRLDLVVVAPWLAAGLTRRLVDAVRCGRYGVLRSVTVAQHKPRFTRSLATSGHPTAFDVELPHSLGVVLALAGPAQLLNAAWSPLVCAGRTLPRMGGARLALRHAGGTHSTLRSDLTSPVRERRITLRLAGAVVTGHYPLAGDDHHAQLVVSTGGAEHREVFPDDALGAFFLAAYRHFQGHPVADVTGFGPHTEVVRLLGEAKAWCAAAEHDSGATAATADVC